MPLCCQNAYKTDSDFVLDSSEEEFLSTAKIANSKRLLGISWQDWTSRRPESLGLEVVRCHPLLNRACFKVDGSMLDYFPSLKEKLSEFKVDQHHYAILPEFFSAFPLAYLRAIQLREDSTNNQVVITVPAHFEEPQRQATINAATIAGYEVLQLVP